MAQERSRFGKDVVMMLASRGIIMFATGIGSIVMARGLGPAGRGTVAVAVNLIMLFVYFGNLGLNIANPYFAARDAERRAQIVANAACLSVAVGLLLVAVGAGIRALFPEALGDVNWPEFIAVLIGIPAALASLLFRSILLGEGRTLAYNVLDAVINVLYVVALVIGFAAFGIGVLATISIAVGAQVLGCFVAVVLVVRRGRPGAPDWTLAVEMLKYAFRAYVAALLSYMVIRLDLLLVNGYLGSDKAGLYSIAATVAEMVYVIPSIVALNLFPRVARGAGHETSAAVFRVVALLYGGLCLISLPLAGVAIEALYGSDFAGAVPLYAWLVPGVFSLGMLNILAHHFAGRGYPRDAVLVWVPGVIFVIAIDVILLPVYGAVVASMASSLAYAVVLVLHMRLFAREAGGYEAFRPRLGETALLLRQALSKRPRESAG